MNLNGHQISKSDVNMVLDQLQAAGSFSPEQIQAAKKELQKMDQTKYNQIIQKGIIQSRDPAFVGKVQKMLGK